MKKAMVLVFIGSFLLVVPGVYAGKTKLTTYYPAPYGEYQTLTSTTGGTFSGLTVGRGGGSVATNTAVGKEALLNNTEGGNNSAFGYQALRSNTTGDYNSAFGASALRNNTTGEANSAFGLTALFNNTQGASNSAFGWRALFSNTTASGNSAFGASALSSNTTGANNSAFGANALSSNTTGSLNTAIGHNALSSNTTGSSNTAVGAQALSGNTTGYGNVAFGASALQPNTIGYYNTALGNEALASITNTIVGSVVQGVENTAVGYQALYNNTTGSQNTALGMSAGSNNADLGTTTGNTTGSNNTFIGYGAVGASSTDSNTITLGNSEIKKLYCQADHIDPLYSTSDARDKKDIVSLPFGMDFISLLKPVAFTWNTRDGAKVGIKSSGFIAQDLQAAQDATPGASETLDLVYAVNPDKLEATPGHLIPVIVKAIQELNARVVSLEEQVENEKKN